MYYVVVTGRSSACQLSVASCLEMWFDFFSSCAVILFMLWKKMSGVELSDIVLHQDDALTHTPSLTQLEIDVMVF